MLRAEGLWSLKWGGKATRAEKRLKPILYPMLQRSRFVGGTRLSASAPHLCAGTVTVLRATCCRLPPAFQLAIRYPCSSHSCKAFPDDAPGGVVLPAHEVPVPVLPDRPGFAELGIDRLFLVRPAAPDQATMRCLNQRQAPQAHPAAHSSPHPHAAEQESMHGSVCMCALWLPADDDAPLFLVHAAGPGQNEGFEAVGHPSGCHPRDPQHGERGDAELHRVGKGQ